MFSLVKFKLLWSQKMLDLRKKGFNDKEIARFKAFFDNIKTINLRSLNDLDVANKEWGAIVNLFYSKARMDLGIATTTIKEAFEVECKTCNLSGSIYPTALLVLIPNGRDHYYHAQYLLTENSEWEYSENGTIIRVNRLYGDKNILAYSTDPLQYLKFKCLPNEKLTANLTQDPCADDEYSGNAPVFLGIELEVERNTKTPTKIEHMVAADLGMDYVILKSDSSIQDGFEIVTAPATLGYHLKAWDRFFENSAKFLQSWASGRCGMHVHITRKAFTPMHLGKLNTFLNNVENREFITTIAGRSSNYSKFLEDKPFNTKSKIISQLCGLRSELEKAQTEAARIPIVSKINAVKARLSNRNDINQFLVELDGVGLGDRHAALNVTKRGTVEIRIFRGNVSKVGFLKNLEFVHAAVEFTREATFRTKVLNEEEKAERKLKRKENTDYALHYTFFVDWLEKDTTGNYNNLKQFLRVRKLTDKFVKRKISSKTPMNKRLSDEEIDAAA